MPMHLLAVSAVSITELSVILSAVCQTTIGLGILMYLPCPNRANVLEFPGFSLRRSLFSFSSLYCAVCFCFFPLWHCGLHGTLSFPLYFEFYKLVLCKLETQYCTFEHCSCWSNIDLNRTPKWVSTTILKSHKGDCFRRGFGSSWSCQLINR